MYIYTSYIRKFRKLNDFLNAVFVTVYSRRIYYLVRNQYIKLYIIYTPDSLVTKLENNSLTRDMTAICSMINVIVISYIEIQLF